MGLPKRTRYGQESIEAIKEDIRHFKAKTVFIISDRNLANAGLTTRLIDALEGSTNRTEIFDRTEPEPTVQSVGAATAAIQEVKNVDMLVSLGGGSVMDTAKCANIMAANGGSILDYEEGRENGRKIGNLLPHAAIPTTAGTGSEATVWAIFIDPKRKFKTGVQDPRLIADQVILDPSATITMPPMVTAATGMDALTHAIESYVSEYANSFTDALALKSIELIASNLRTATKDGEDIEARSCMLLASYMAGIAFSNSSCGIVHTLAETLGGFYRISHGVANSLMLPRVMKFNLTANHEKFSQIASLMGEDIKKKASRAVASKSVDAVVKLRKELGLPTKMREVGVRKKDIPTLARMAFRWANASGNPRSATLNQLRTIYDDTY